MDKTCLCICLFFLIFVVIPIGIFLVFRLVIFPTRFSVSVEEALIDVFHITNDGRMNLALNLGIISYDPSLKNHIYQDLMISILQEKQILKEKFYKNVNVSRTRNVHEARMRFRLVASYVVLEESVEQKLRSESKNGVVKLGVDMRGRLNVYDHVKVNCRDVVVNIVSNSTIYHGNTKFKRKKCYVERHGNLYIDDSN